jgi:nucleoside-diphosphate-sugar epimerase
MTILLSGGSGFLGSHIAEQLSRAGHSVRALVRHTSDTSFLQTLDGVELRKASLSEREGVVKAAEGCTGIIHCAGLVKARSEEEFNRVNVGGTENMLAAARSIKDTLRRFVHVSSGTVGGPSDEHGTPVSVDAPARPLTPYARSKRAAERSCLALKDELPITILRPGAIYGPRDREILAIFKTVNLRLLPYMGSPEHKLSMIHGADCGAACIAALDADVPSGSIFSLSDGRVHRFADLFDAIEQALGKRAWVRFPLPERLVRAIALANEGYGKLADKAVMLTREKCNELFNQWVCESEPAFEALGWRPAIDIRDGIQETADWYRANGWL